ncbi:hypothetical protein [Rhizobium leguminosarum]|nr:hypothetical protein [Rhizobium leguminosarum]MCA2411243.1 hypothetical protein [Rhizobium leguminosarum]
MTDDDEFRYTSWGAKLGGRIYWNAIIPMVSKSTSEICERRESFDLRLGD